MNYCVILFTAKPAEELDSVDFGVGKIELDSWKILSRGYAPVIRFVCPTVQIHYKCVASFKAPWEGRNRPPQGIPLRIPLQARTLHASLTSLPTTWNVTQWKIYLCAKLIPTFLQGVPSPARLPSTTVSSQTFWLFNSKQLPNLSQTREHFSAHCLHR